MKLIIAEKPDIAKAVSKVLPGTPKWNNGYIEQGDYYISWCYGHLLTLKDPEDYGAEYARSNTPNEKLPIFFNDWGMKVADKGAALLKNGKNAPDKGAQLKTIGGLLKKSSLVIIAGDVDDEGQLLVEEVLEWHKYMGPVKRLDTGALNEASLKKAMANLMDNAPWHMRAVSARARSVADFALGVNGSRFFSNLYRSNLSVGRVQTAALGLVVARDALIEGHSATKYYTLTMSAAVENGGSHEVKFSPREDDPHLLDGKILDEAYLQRVGKVLTDRKVKACVSKEQAFEHPPLPFSISALKTYCSSKFNLPPEEVLRITQSLRMNYGGLITYNRSECRYLPENMHPEASGIIAAVVANLGNRWNFPGLDATRKSKAFNDKCVGVHHAIIPTAQKADLSKLTENELRVYKAICGFYMVQFMPPAEKEQTRLSVACSEGQLSAVSTRLMSSGFKVVMETEKDEVNALSDVPAGEYDCTLRDFRVTGKQTKPPKRYTDSSLEEDMKNVAKYVTDPEAKRLLLLKDKDSREEHGSIGTAATRSAIIQTLKKRGFLKNEGKNVVSTDTGRQFYSILPDEIRKPDLTAKWWAIQQDIQDGNASPEDLYREVLAAYARFASLPYPVLNLSKDSGAQEKAALGVCPRCGKSIVEGKKGFGCSGYKDGCSFTVWKEGRYGAHKALAVSKKKITPAMVKKLLTDGKALVKGLISEKTGAKYDAFVVMHDTGSGVFLNLDFEGVPKPKK